MTITKDQIEAHLKRCLSERERLAGHMNQLLGVEEFCRSLLVALDAPAPPAPEPAEPVGV